MRRSARLDVPRDLLLDVNIWVGIFQGVLGTKDLLRELRGSCCVHSNTHVEATTLHVLRRLDEAGSDRVERFGAFMRLLVADTGGSFDDTALDYRHDGELTRIAHRFYAPDVEDAAVVMTAQTLQGRLGRRCAVLTMDAGLRSYCADRGVLAVTRRDLLLARRPDAI